MGVRTRLAAPLLASLCSVALPPAAARAAEAAAPEPADPPGTIIVYGERSPSLSALRADDELDADAIAAYGADTVGDLLDSLGGALRGDPDGPFVLINGQPASGLDDIIDLPVEAVARIQLLSRGAAAALGQRPTRRVVNVVVRPDHRQATATARGRVATAGDGEQGEGELNLLKLDQGNRRSLVLKVMSQDALLESERGIDGLDGPDEGRFRTLLPELWTASANANVSQKLGRHALSLTLRADRQESRARTGLAGLEPLDQRGEANGLSGALVANGPIGAWRYSLNANAGRRSSRTLSERGAPLPERARGRTTNAGAHATLTGTPFAMPAGAATVAARAEWKLARGDSRTIGPGGSIGRERRREELLGQLGAQVPLVDSAALGGVALEASAALHHVNASGWLEDYGIGLNWRPDERLGLRVMVNREEIAPPAGVLTDPLVTVENYRTFDFIRQETVFVTYLTGGNPDLGIERRDLLTLSATWNPIDSEDLTITADYRRVRSRGAFSGLPAVTAEIQAAFPDRFQRDGSGRLIAIDARAVAFALARRDEIRWGATFSRTFGEAAAGETPGFGRGVRVHASLDHLWTLASTRKARAGLPTVDLLDGGAAGYGGGVPAHIVDFGGGIVHRGIGLEVEGSWTSATRIMAGTAADPQALRFAARALIDARLFVNLGPQLPGQAWAKGARLSLAAENLFDSKQRVRDSSGATPLGYQPYLLDPLGRTLTLSLRKVF